MFKTRAHHERAGRSMIDFLWDEGDPEFVKEAGIRDGALNFLRSEASAVSRARPAASAAHTPPSLVRPRLNLQDRAAAARSRAEMANRRNPFAYKNLTTGDKMRSAPKAALGGLERNSVKPNFANSAAKPNFANSAAKPNFANPINPLGPLSGRERAVLRSRAEGRATRLKGRATRLKSERMLSNIRANSPFMNPKNTPIS